jgi:hypothetical protein
MVLRASRAAAPALVRLEDANEGSELHAKPNTINEDKEEEEDDDFFFLVEEEPSRFFSRLDNARRRSCNDDDMGLVVLDDVGIHFMMVYLFVCFVDLNFWRVRQWKKAVGKHFSC